jgi:hypothetical protein
VYNTLTIQGDQLSIARLKKHVGQPYTRPFAELERKDKEWVTVAKETTFNNPVFSFWNIVEPEDIKAYIFDESTGVPEEGKEWFTSNNWYDWNIRNWGTKWDVANADEDSYPETELMIDEENRLQYSFNTAWAPPTKAIGWLSKQYPSLKFNLDYEEETGWGGEIEFTDATEVELEEYGWKCRECDHTEEETPWCDECHFDICPECGYGEPSDVCEQHKEKVNG